MLDRPSTPSEIERLRQAGIRPTRPRTVILRAVAAGGLRHLTAESFHQELLDQGREFSLATIYNTLNNFADCGLLRRVACGDRRYFCTNTETHHHFYDPRTGRIEDIPDSQGLLGTLPEPPTGTMIEGVDVIIRLRRLPQT